MSLGLGCGNDKRGRNNSNLNTNNNGSIDGSCSIDNSRDFSTAWEITESDIQNGISFSDSICPTFDEDFWHLSLSGERLLVDVAARLDETGAVALAMDWIGPQGLCVIDPSTQCANDSDCSQGRCDQFRNVCRPFVALQCFNDQHCESGQKCMNALAQSFYDASTDFYFPIATAREYERSASVHEIRTSFLAIVPNQSATSQATDFYLRVYDSENYPHKNNYEFTVALHQDPDIHEFNNEKHMAALIQSDQSITGYLAYTGDVDWYKLEPSFTPAVVEIDMTWTSTSLGMQPTWKMEQMDRIYEAPENAAAHAKSAYILTSQDPIFIEVKNLNTIVGGDNPYTLMVSIKHDTVEEAIGTRNDTADHATTIPVNNPGDTGQFSDSIIAHNDRDWYRITKSNNTENSLLEISLATPIENRNPEISTDVPYLMMMRVYYATGKSCTDNSACNSKEICIMEKNECMIWLQRPRLHGIDGETGSVQYGGAPDIRNNLHAQLPFFGGQDIYILVQHIGNNIYDLLGYSDTVRYALNLAHHTEPDTAGDLTSTDNQFVPRPLEIAADYRDLHKSSRNISYNSNWSWSGTGFISYEGDADFFSIPLPDDFPTGSMTFTVWSGSINTAISVARSGSQNSLGGCGVSILQRTGTCDPCSRSGNNECIFLDCSGNYLNVYIQDYLYNNYDVNTAYRFTIDYWEGCPTQHCNEYQCGTAE